MEDNELPDWLPVGWRRVTTVRKSGQKDRCYIAPSTGLKFYSKPKVFRYLKTLKLDGHTSKQKKRGTCIHSPVVVEKVTDDELPPGWIKEIRIRKTANGIRKDPQYIDPVSGYIFRSKKGASRYLQNGELGRNTVKRKKRVITDMESNDKVTPPTATKRPKLASCARRQLFAGCSSKSNEIVENEQCLESSATEQSVSLSKYASDQCGDDPLLSSLVPEKKLAEKWLKKSGSRKPQIRLDKSKDKKELILPRRTSKRLAGLEAEQARDTDRSHQVHLTDKQSAEGNSPDSCVRRASMQLDKLEAKPEVESAPCPSSNIDVSSEKEPSKGKEPLNESKRPIGNQIAPEEHNGRLEVEIQTDEKQQSPHIFPFGDSWPDPVLEFAFKTLTGAIPLEDNIAIENYFQQNLSIQQPKTADGGLVLPDLHLDGFSKTNRVLQFDTQEEAVSTQQLNMGLPSSGENAPQPPLVQGFREHQGQLSH